MSTVARHALHLNFDSAKASWNRGIFRIFDCEQGLPDRLSTGYMLLVYKLIRASEDGPKQDAYRTQIRCLPREFDGGTRKRRAMSALTAAVVLTLAAQWGQPVAPKTIVAEATVESGLDPLAIHDNATGRTFHPASAEEAIQIATRLDGAVGNYDVGLMQINRANFDWLHLTLAGALDPRRSIEAGAAVMVSMSRYNTGNLRGFENGYVEKVLAASQRLNGAPVPRTPLPGAASVMPAAPAPSSVPSAPPPVVLDMLHATETPPDAPDQVTNLLGGLAPVGTIEAAER